MNEIERLNPGLVVRADRARTPVVRQSVALTGRTAKIVLDDLKRRQRRGEVESAGQLQLITKGALAGQYAVRVVMLPEPRRAHLTPRLLAATGLVLLGVASVVGAFAWLLTSMSAASVAGLCVILLAVLGLAVLASSDRRKRGGNVTVISNINVTR